MNADKMRFMDMITARFGIGIKRFLHETRAVPVYGFLLLYTVMLAGCSTNPATGQEQFTAFMSPAQEKQIGAQEHEKVVREYGLYEDPALQAYVQRVGQKVVRYTERSDVAYQFYLLDSPIVNAFALPGGYIYITRGVLALSDNEAQLAAVLGHEAGHITGRHSAERYSRTVATSLGAGILSAVIDSSGVSQALGVGSDLYLKSYSRGQESQADTLGIRYLTRAGYAPTAMTDFLRNMQADSALEAKIEGSSQATASSFFSTHPATAERVSDTIGQAQQYPQEGLLNRESHLRAINGMVFGDSVRHGFVRGQHFFHPVLGFTFSVPDGYRLMNTPDKIIAQNAQNGGLIVFDFAANKERLDPAQFLRDVWLKAQSGTVVTENIMVNGMRAATTEVQGRANNGAAVRVRLVAIQWTPDRIVRFQITLPQNVTQTQEDALKSSTYSFRAMTQKEKGQVRPYRLVIVQAKAGDRVASLSQQMAQERYKAEYFRVLNAMNPSDEVIPGRLYKIVTE